MSGGNSSATSTVYRGLKALAGCGGCAAKAPASLVSLLSAAALTGLLDGRVLVGLSPADDAAVYAIDAERALIATVDFFPPIVDDPDDYGAVAAANAVSDIYAMGGAVAFALALSGFPEAVPSQVVSEVARAAAGVVAACGGAIIGGHSIRCAEPVFGLCVLGFAHPARVWRKSGALPGDVLMLSKPIGTGVLISQNLPRSVAVAVASMRATNQNAAVALRELAGGPHAVTDISGFGLIGHSEEMAHQSGLTMRIDSSRVPLLSGALRAAGAGVRTSMHAVSSQRLQPEVRIAGSVSEAMRALLHDPQTSGGLLAAVSPSDAARLQRRGFTSVGLVMAGPPGVIVD